MKPWERPNRTFIIPSWEGSIFASFVLCVFIIAAWNNLSWCYVTGFVMLAFFLISVVQTNSNIDSFSIKFLTGSQVSAGEWLTLYFRFTGKTDAYNVEIELLFEPLTVKAFYPCLQVNQDFSLQVPTNHRGLLKIPLLRVSSRFPVALFYSWKYFEQYADILVLPKAQGNSALPQNIQKGVQLPNDEDDFFEHTPYRLGHSLNHIDWKAHARGHPLLIKKQHTQQLISHVLLNWEDFTMEKEAKISQLCQWIKLCESRSLPYSLQLPQQHLVYSPDGSHQLRCLKALALLE